MRPTWNELFIKIAFEISKRSTCLRIKVGAVLVKDKRIISMGYNGVPSGEQHCEDYFKSEDNFLKVDICLPNYKDYLESKRFYQDHHEFAIKNEIHAEINAILFAAKNGISTDVTDMYVTFSPCIHCSKALLQAGIRNVYYNQVYERDKMGLKFLLENEVKCTQVELEIIKV